MIEITAVELSEIDFSPYGEVVRLEAGGPDVVTSQGDGWSGVFSKNTVIGQAGSLGYTLGTNLPTVTTTMEQHHHTKEALFPAAGPIALAVADTKADAPHVDDIRAVIIRPGTLVVLHEGIWHDACHGLGQDTPYYWYAYCDPNIVDPWTPITGGPIRLSL